MGASITLAGESLIAQKHAAQLGLDVTRFIFANVPGLDPSGPVDRAAPKPDAAQIVHVYDIPRENAGYVNPNQVVYSSQIGSDVGDWDFNWIGLETAEGVLFAVAYVPLQIKRRNIPPLQIGNNLTRNFLVAFDGAQALTGITIDASTWQHDFTVRLAGIDERERLSNRDVFGRACFFGASLQLVKVGSAYQLQPGSAYVEGIRLVRSAALAVVPLAFPTTAWLDVSLQRELSDVVASWNVVFAADRPDYTDSAGVRHYCVALADLPNAGTVTDRRSVELIDGPLVKHFAARTGDYEFLRARATTKEDVGLGNLPNAKSDDPSTNSSDILATTAALNRLQQQVGDSLTGMVASFAMSAAPSGWLKCNGAVVSRTTFASLFARIGTVFGAGDGTSTFGVPDLRGLFLRGLDDGRGIDAARVLGAYQEMMHQSHTHTASASADGNHIHGAWTDSQGAHTHATAGAPGIGQGAPGVNSVQQSSGAHETAWAGAHSHNVGMNGSGNHSHAITVNAAGAAETRPKNIALLFCIKY